MTKLETVFTAALWLAATVLLPLAALAPVESIRANVRLAAEPRACVSLVVASLRTCSSITL